MTGAPRRCAIGVIPLGGGGAAEIKTEKGTMFMVTFSDKPRKHPHLNETNFFLCFSFLSSEHATYNNNNKRN